jgi:SAM-dependent methyltransferase
MDPTTVKQQQYDTWRAVASGWKTWAPVMTRLSAPVTAKMIEGLRPGQRVLDLASGVGDPAIAAARRVAPGGSVLGIDQVEDMLSFAREEARAAGVSNLEFRCADAERVDVPPASYDHVTMRFGLMFMPDPVACLTHLRGALKSGGSIHVAVWQGPDVNPWAAIPVSVLRRHVEVPTPPPEAPGLFAFADRTRLEAVCRTAGFAAIHTEAVEVVMVDFATGDEYLRFLCDLAGPIALLLKQVSEASRARVDAEIVREVSAFGGGRPLLPGRVWVLSATRP